MGIRKAKYAGTVACEFVIIILRVLRVPPSVSSVFLLPGIFGTRRTQREEHGGHGGKLSEKWYKKKPCK
jgi:hypothetical protein